MKLMKKFVFMMLFEKLYIKIIIKMEKKIDLYIISWKKNIYRRILMMSYQMKKEFFIIKIVLDMKDIF